MPGLTLYHVVRRINLFYRLNALANVPFGAAGFGAGGCCRDVGCLGACIGGGCCLDWYAVDGALLGACEPGEGAPASAI